MYTKTEAENILVGLGDGVIDFSLVNGLLRSDKEMWRSQCDPHDSTDRNGMFFTVFHGIDGSLVEFTFDQAVEVLTGERSPWDGVPLVEDSFECECCWNTFDIEDSIEQVEGGLFCPSCNKGEPNED